MRLNTNQTDLYNRVIAKTKMHFPTQALPILLQNENSPVERLIIKNSLRATRPFEDKTLASGYV